MWWAHLQDADGEGGRLAGTWEQTQDTQGRSRRVSATEYASNRCNRARGRRPRRSFCQRFVSSAHRSASKDGILWCNHPGEGGASAPTTHVNTTNAPDWAWAMTSRPIKMGLTARCWIADGFSNPYA